MSTMTPREIVSELDRYIVGQDDAKRAVAIALRNRWRRQQPDDDLREDVLPMTSRPLKGGRERSPAVEATRVERGLATGKRDPPFRPLAVARPGR